MTRTIRSLALLAVFLLHIYLGVAFTVFRWCNPTANDFACWRELPAALRFQKLERYQPRP